jgi:thiol-disulfide isomerase/thioredoxin
MPVVAVWQHDHAGILTIAVVSRDQPGANHEECDLNLVLLQADREVSKAYQAHGTPSAVLIRTDGTIGSPLARGSVEIRSLIERAVYSRPAPVALVPRKVGESAPALRLSGLDGSPIDITDFRGVDILVLFWNPRCGFCARMLPDIKAWEASPPPGSPELLVISSGAIEDIRAMGFRSPVLFDPNLAAIRAFGALGTPSAVLVDPKWRIASELAVGAAAIFSLAKTPAVQMEPQSIPAK